MSAGLRWRRRGLSGSSWRGGRNRLNDLFFVRCCDLFYSLIVCLLSSHLLLLDEPSILQFLDCERVASMDRCDEKRGPKNSTPYWNGGGGVEVQELVEKHEGDYGADD